MPDVHVYIALEKMNINDAQWATVKSTFATKAKNQAMQAGLTPAEVWHTRDSLDGTKLIGDTVFDSANVGVVSLIAVLASTFNVDPADVESSDDYDSNGRFVILAYPLGGQNRLTVRLLGFSQGGGWSQFFDQSDIGKEKSRLAAADYLLNNLAEWQTEVEV